MDEYIDLSVEPGQAEQGLKTVAGLAWLVVVIWHTIPGLTLFLLIPPLALCLYPLVVTPLYGFRMDAAEIWLLLGRQDHRVALSDIDHLRVTFRPARDVTVLVLRDGTEMVLPTYLSPDPWRLIKEAHNRGVAVRLT